MIIMVIKLSGFADLFIFFTPAPVVSVLEDRHIMQNQGHNAVPLVRLEPTNPLS